ncbi:DUF5655 domain-containing protein [Nocardia brasiliensis]|uniref:DUF5655 domain-containing protein n=1 Tax=Nocardia brasiliensis TaxID=37326 RepID=UPI0003154B34|nr:DUF5655 domain-containing protein [Nocardia brasiliensis]
MDERAVERLFADRPEALRLFRAFVPRIAELGGIGAEVMKTQVSFAADRKFAWLWPLPVSRGTPPDVLMLTLVTRSRFTDPLIRSAEQNRPGTWTLQIRITDESVIERVLDAGWLDAAYDFGLQRPREP